MIAYLVIGFIAGFIAEKVMHREHGIIQNILVGIVGSLLGGFVSSLIGIYSTSFVGSLVIATLGAIAFLWLYDYFKNRQ